MKGYQAQGHGCFHPCTDEAIENGCNVHSLVFEPFRRPIYSMKGSQQARRLNLESLVFFLFILHFRGIKLGKVRIDLGQV